MESSETIFSGTERALEAAARYDVAAAAAGRKRARYAAGADRRRASRAAASRAARETIAAMPDGDERTEAEEKFRKKADAGKRAAETAKREKELVRARLRDGFVQAGSTYVGGREVEPFCEEGLRSREWGTAAKLFLRGLPRKGKLRTGRDRAVMYERYRSKLLSCDEPYVEGNRAMTSLIRVDLDQDHDVEALKASLQALVDSGDLPCMPHFVVGREEQRVDTIDDLLAGDRGRTWVARPHLWWVLPDAVAVMQAPPRKAKKGETKAEPRSPIRKKPVRLLDAVYRGLVSVLVPLGADPKAKWRLVRGKNPLSPYWQAACWNQESFPSLSEHAEVLGDRMRKTVEDLTREAAALAAGTRTMSNVFFDAACRLAWSTLRDWHARAWGPYQKSLEELPDDVLLPLLRERLTVSAVVDTDNDVAVPKRAERVLDLVAGYAARSWDPAKADAVIERSRRGRLSHLTAGVRALSDRQAIAARVTAAGRAQEAQSRILKAMDAVERNGSPFTQAEVSRASGLNRKTVGKHWRFCLSRRPRRCLVKKGSLNPVSLRGGTAMSAPVRLVPSTVRVGRTAESRTPDSTVSVVTRPPSRPVPRNPVLAVTGTADTVVSRPPARSLQSRTEDSVRPAVVDHAPRPRTPIAPGMFDLPKRPESVSTGTPGIRTESTPSVTGQAVRSGVFGPGSDGWPPRPPAVLFMRGGLPKADRDRAELERRIKARIDGMALLPPKRRTKAG